jgi:NAD(P)-dependent dehydrogenase (short-subunit alcohol dehydrogenase family)
VEYLAADLADFSLGKKAVDLAVSKFGHLDGLIINHGVLNPVKRISETEAKEWSQAFDINVFSAIAMVCIGCRSLTKALANPHARSKQPSQLSAQPKEKLSLFPLEQQSLHTRHGVRTVPPRLY